MRTIIYSLFIILFSTNIALSAKPACNNFCYMEHDCADYSWDDDFGGFYGTDDYCHCVYNEDCDPSYDTDTFQVVYCYQNSNCPSGQLCEKNQCVNVSSSSCKSDSDFISTGNGIDKKVIRSYNSSTYTCTETSFVVRCSAGYYNTKGYTTHTLTSTSSISTYFNCTKCPSNSTSNAASTSCTCTSGYYMNNETCTECPYVGIGGESSEEIFKQLCDEYFGYEDDDYCFDNDVISTLDDIGPGVDDFEDMVNETGEQLGVSNLCTMLDCRENYHSYTVKSLIETIDHNIGVGCKRGSSNNATAISGCYIPPNKTYTDDTGIFSVTSNCYASSTAPNLATTCP